MLLQGSWAKKYDCRLGTALIDFLIKYDRTKQTPRKLPYFQKFDTKLISLPIFDRRQIPFISSVLIVCLWSKTNLCLNFILKYKLPKLRRCASQVVSIPHTCHIFYTHTFWGLKILHSKVRKFTTKKASRQNSVKPHTLCKITHSMCNYTLCVKLHTVCKITHCVWNSTYSTRFHRGSFRVKYGKNSSHFKIFTPTLLVALATNMRYVNARVG